MLPPEGSLATLGSQPRTAAARGTASRAFMRNTTFGGLDRRGSFCHLPPKLLSRHRATRSAARSRRETYKDGHKQDGQERRPGSCRRSFAWRRSS
jgi:hypothetical protein